MLLASVLVQSPAGTGGAAEQAVIGDFSSGAGASSAPAGWELKERSGTADVATVKDGQIGALRLRSRNTSFSVQKRTDVDLSRYPVLSWRWKVTELPGGGDFRSGATDDQAAQVFVAFSKFQAIVYVWDTTAPQGMTGDAVGVWPMKIKVIVVRSGAGSAGAWLSESRNVREDYRRLFGAEPPRVQGIRLQINSQHTGTSAESFFADVAFRETD